MLRLNYPCPAGVYDEVFQAPGRPRPHWQPFARVWSETTTAELIRRSQQAERLLRDNGVTYHVFADGDNRQRPWRLDLLPLILAADEWSTIDAAIRQRARVLELLVQDVYGVQSLLHDGTLPPAAIFANPLYSRAFHQLHPPGRRSLIQYAAELARNGDGEWRVMADRSETPAGAGFALENRIVVARSIPSLIQHAQVQRLAPFFLQLQHTLRDLAPRRHDSVRTVVLTPGPSHQYFFEDVYLANYLGYTLVHGGDLAVRDDRLYVKTLAGLLPVDVVLSRGSERGVDPLELGGGAAHGVPGLLQAIRKGNVAMGNVPGCGLAEAPIFMAFLPRLCRRLLGEELKLPSIPTWWCGEAESFQYVLDHWNDLVIKPAFQPSGGEEIFGERLSMGERAELIERIRQRPYAYIAQEKIERSAVPVWDETTVRCGHVALRVFATAEGDGFRIMPGGLIRVARTPEPMQLSIAAGDGSKDLWVLADGPIEPVTLLPADDHALPLRRTGALFPSRVADDLFWLGQSLERVDVLCRMLRSVIDRLASESERNNAELPMLIRVLADQGQIEAGHSLPDMHRNLPRLTEILPQYVSNVGEPRGLASAVSEMLRLVSQVRDWISPDTWRTIFHAGRSFQGAARDSWSSVADVLVSCNQLISEMAAASGLIHEGMIRGPAWRFLEMGRRIERGRSVATTLGSAMASGQIGDRDALKAILELIDCRMTYRSRYLNDVQRNTVFDLCVTDETNPRSIVYQAVAVADHVDALPHDSSLPLRTEEKRMVMAVLHRLRMITPEQLAAADLQPMQVLLSEVDQQLKHLGDQLTRKYLVHSGAPRQITVEDRL